MKITVKQYARSLYELIEGKSKTEVKEVITNFINFLVKNRDLNKAEEIINELEKFWSEADGELKAEIISARGLGKEARNLAIDYLKDKTKSEKIILEEKVDKKILGGFILRYEGKIIDGSLKNNLENLKAKMEV
ncbi:MAG: ATP synthase F1 subunit delta [Candidatus Falkowbacteria bacterium]|nr:ATP synthase F1 subunit delta [Candidatus Falkowbacteria bacterium]